ncbi:hypothetical protein QU487_02530 [Crenobacter sp. SG2305]|uniref:hypothetical protein n=1 Tax=Crenobacter oryzisoli TaxID=3056844 RepID=UPI0025AA38BF|nr:hypothetical protein [Crenobacter sp. SG2305]MDN0081637.1 hypothetical protein [Crenobacter sp. SG2305]
MGAYENFQAVRAGLLPAASANLSNPLTTVEALQRKVMSLEQLDAIAQLQAALLALGEMERSINSLIILNRLPVQGIQLFAAGRLHHDLEDVLFEHKSASGKLQRGEGLVPAVGESELRREAVVLESRAA